MTPERYITDSIKKEKYLPANTSPKPAFVTYLQWSSAYGQNEIIKDK
jgi:hypothetical protein